MSRLGDEFLGIPKAIRERRLVSWAAKALACHVRFRQGGRQSISIGVRRLSIELGLSSNAILRAEGEAATKGLLRILNPEARRGQRRIFDARVLDVAESASKVESLSGKQECTRTEGTTDSKAESPKRTRTGVTSAPDCASRKEKESSVKKGRERPPAPPLSQALTDDSDNDGRLFRIFVHVHGEPTEAEAARFRESVSEAQAKGAPEPLIAHHVLRSGKAATPWAGPNAAREATKQILKSFNEATDLSCTSFGDVLKAIEHAKSFLAGPPGREGRLHNERVADWAKKNAEVITAASIWPDYEPAATAPDSRQARQ